MTKQIHGTINLPGNVDITDPGYDEDVWCRINNFPIEPGEYECYTYTMTGEESGWGDRIAEIGIRCDTSEYYERKGMIGVDGGMAGFFNCDNKLAFEQYMNECGFDENVYLSDNAFFSTSGYGDGGYDVYAGYKDGKIVEVYIEFIRGKY